MAPGWEVPWELDRYLKDGLPIRWDEVDVPEFWEVLVEPERPVRVLTPGLETLMILPSEFETSGLSILDVGTLRVPRWRA